MATKHKCVKELLEEIALLDALLEKKVDRLEIKDDKIETLKERIAELEAEECCKNDKMKKLLKEIEAKAKIIEELEDAAEKADDELETLRERVVNYSKKFHEVAKLADDVVEYCKYGKVK